MQNTELLLLRSKVDAIDSEIIDLLAKRFDITAEIGKLKAQASLNPIDPDREAIQTERYKSLATQRNLNPEVVVNAFSVIIAEVVRKHRAI